MTGRSGWVALAFVVVLAAAAQVAGFDFAPTSHADDFLAYASNADAIIHGRPYAMHGYIMNTNFDQGSENGQAAYPPGYPLLLAPVIGLFGDGLRAMAVFNCVLYVAFTALFATYARRRAGLWGGVVAGALLALSPTFLNQGTLQAPSEPAFLMVLTLVLLTDDAIRGRSGESTGPVGMAALMGLAMLMRIVSVVLPPAFVLAEWGRAGRLTLRPVLTATASGLVLMAGLVLLSWDYVANNWAVLAVPPGTVGSQGLGIADKLGTQLAAVAANVSDMPGNLSAIWSYALAATTGADPAWHHAEQLGTLVALGCVGVGFVAAVRRGASLCEWYFVLQLLVLLNLTALLRSPRYWLPVSVLALLYAVMGAGVIGGWAGRGRRSPALAQLALALAVGVALPSNLGRVLRSPVRQFSSVSPSSREFYGWVAAHTAPDAVIVAHQPRTVAYFTGRFSSDYHQHAADAAFLDWARHLHAGYLVLSTDQREVVRVPGDDGLAPEAAPLNAALDRYEDQFLAGERGRFEPVFRNGRYRLFRIIGVP